MFDTCLDLENNLRKVSEQASQKEYETLPKCTITDEKNLIEDIPSMEKSIYKVDDVTLERHDPDVRVEEFEGSSEEEVETKKVRKTILNVQKNKWLGYEEDSKDK